MKKLSKGVDNLFVVINFMPSRRSATERTNEMYYPMVKANSRKTTPTLFDAFDSMFDEVFGSPWISKNYTQNLDVTEYKDGKYKLRSTVAGYGDDDLTVQVDENDYVLHISSKDKKIKRSILLPQELNLETLRYECDKGLLIITAEDHPENSKKSKLRDVKKLISSSDSS